MTYYKITYESNSIDGLKALQGSFLGNGASNIDSSTIETTVSPPPLHQDVENVNSFLGEIQAPPISEGSEASFEKSSFFPPPSLSGDSAINETDSEGGISPPPLGEQQDQAGNDKEIDGGSVPPQQSSSKKPKGG